MPIAKHIESRVFAWSHVFLCILYISIIPLSAQKKGFSEDINIEFLENWSGKEVRTFTIDSRQNFWAETKVGIDVYDGIITKTLYPPDMTYDYLGYTQYEVMSFRENYNKMDIHFINNYTHFNAWSITENKFIRIPYNWELETNFNNLKFVDRRNDVWLLSFDSNQLHFRSYYNEEQYIIKNELNVTPYYVAWTKDGFWIFDINEELYFLSFSGSIQKIKQNYQLKNDMVQNVRTCFTTDNTGRLYYGHKENGGLYTVANGSTQAQLDPRFPKDHTAINAWHDKLGNIMFGFSKAILHITNFQLLTKNEEVVYHPEISDLNTIGYGCYGDDFERRLCYYSHVGLHLIQFKAEFLDNAMYDATLLHRAYGNIITGIFPHKDSFIIAYEEAGKIMVFNEYTETYELHYNADKSPCSYKPEKIGNAIWSIFCDTFSQVFNQNILRVDLNTFEEKKYFTDINIKHFTPIDSNKLLLHYQTTENTYRMKLFEIPSGNIKDVTLAQDDPLRSVTYGHTILLPSNELLICTNENGILIADISDFNNVSSRKVDLDGFPDRNIISAKRTDAYYLIGTYDGLYKVSLGLDQVIEHISKDDGLTNHIVASALPQESGELWISTFNGLNVYDSLSNIIGQFHKLDGLLNEDYTRNVSYYSPNTQRLYFGSGNGVTIVNNEKYIESKSHFNVILNRIELKDDHTDSTFYTNFSDLPSIHYGNNTSIRLVLNSDEWMWNKKGTFRYLLTNIERDWSYTSSNIIDLPRLPIGTHEVIIQAISKNGYLSSNEIKLKFTVYAFFYEKIWFRVLLGTLFLSGAIIYFFYLRRSNILAKAKQAQKMAELELRILQSQLNPHFIFNAIGSIQYFIFKKETTLADRYLSEFAKLMRSYLESSRHEMINLKDEISMLKSYLNIEQLRFKKPFRFEIDSTELKDALTNYLIPTMLMQPFVENSVKHGLFHKNEKGHLNIKLSESDHYLNISIEDDGIGRKASAIINNKRKSQHKSRAMDINDERIHLMSDLYEQSSKIEIIDLTDKDGNATGTRVIIQILLNKTSQDASTQKALEKT